MKVRGIYKSIFYSLLILNILVMLDVTILGIGFASGNINSFLTSVRWDEYQPTTGEVVLYIDADLPPSGILPKSVLIELELDIVNWGFTDAVTDHITFGENKLVELRVVLPPEFQFQLDLGGTVEVIPYLTLYMQIFNATIPGTGRILELSPELISY